MESTTSSGEELFVKTRKPYTITKQREKWTEEEHGKFIDALKLYGRAWQRIEEHIGTKTAVQIRSHAQKFFTKLEKEALIKGIPFGQAHDIEIPPPRPKRKPSNPYPRNTGVGSLSSSVGAMDNKTSKSPSPLSVCKQATEKENNAPRKTQGAEDNSEGGSQSEVLNLFQDAPSASVCSLSKGSSNSSAFKGFVPLVKGIREKISKDSSMFPDVSKELEGNDVSHRNHDTEEVKELHVGSHSRSAQNGAEANASEKPEKVGIPMDCQQGDQSYSKHVPMEFIKGNSEKDIQMTVAGQAAPHTNAKPSFDPITPSTSDFYTNSGISSIHQSFPAFQPYTQLQGNHDAYRSFLNVSNFSGLILSTCLQNPAVHAAACLAASFWPSAGADASLDLTSQTSVGGTPAGHMNSSPSMAAIAAATVAAASAWWATQGLLPAFPPFRPGFAFAPVPTTTINTVDTIQVPRERKEEEGGTLNYSNRVNQPVVEPEQSEALKAQCPSSKSFPSSSDSDQCVRNDLKVLTTDKLKPTADDGFHDSDKVTSKKKLDRSSCGSNTPSCSEVETDVLEKQNEDNDEAKQDYFNNLLSGDTNARRARSTGSMNESWKEVSEEGRIAFRALFTRGVLPQSFSPSHPSDSMVHTYQDEEVISELAVDLNMKACESETAVLPRVQEYGDTDGKGFSTSEIGHGKLKARRTGFKPYKRCSMEAKESLSPTGEEGGNKRIRLEGETSI